MNRKTCPFADYNGEPIREGDIIQHPRCETLAVVIYLADEDLDTDKWRAVYPHDGAITRLSLQVGPRGQAVVISPTAQNN